MYSTILTVDTTCFWKGPDDELFPYLYKIETVFHIYSTLIKKTSLVIC